jgi:hypothetical protein
MSDIQFDNNYGMDQGGSSDVPGMTGWLIKKGIAKNRKSAEMMMLVFAIAGIIFSIFQITNNLG